MRALVILCSALLLALFALSAQEYIGGGDFLTDHEVEMIREAQEPDKRIETYLHFALLRLELIKQKLAVEEAGRSVAIHRNLGEYSQIIDAIDLVVEDALLHEVEMGKAIELLTKQESEFLATLKNIEEKPADDHWRYEFVLDDAIEITGDSIELAKADLGERKREIMEADAEDRKEIRDSMVPAAREGMEKAKKATARKEAEEKRKRPTLLKSGEKEQAKP